MSRPIDRELSFEVTVNALVTKAAPETILTRFAAGEVVNVEIIIPAGVAGTAGLRISCSGTQLFPINTGAWLIGDDETITRDVYNWPNSGRLDVEAYNEDTHAHTFQVRYAVAENPLPAPAAPVSSPPIQVGDTGEPIQVPAEQGGAGSGPSESPGTPPPPPEAEEPLPPAPPEEQPKLPGGETEGPPGGAPEPPPEATPETPGEAPGEPAPTEAPPGEAEAEIPGELETEEPEGAAAPGGPAVKAAHATKRKPAPKTKTKTVKEKVSLPAGGWLPHGARFTLQRQDQGQDFITAWKGPIVAPANGTVVHVLKDKPYPAGFGPSYAVVHIDSGPFGGKDWYIGHCTSAVKAGQHFKAGQVLAHADQGHVNGGGWCELGYAPNGYPGAMTDGKKFAGLFKTVVKTVTKKVAAGAPKRKPKAGVKKKASTKKGTAKRAKPTGKPKAKKPAAKRAKPTKTPKVKAPKAKRAPRVKKVKAPKAPRVKKVKAPKAKRAKPAAKAAAPRKKKR